MGLFCFLTPFYAYVSHKGWRKFDLERGAGGLLVQVILFAKEVILINGYVNTPARKPTKPKA